MWMLFFRTIMSRPYIYLALFLSFSWLRYSLFLSSASEMLVRTYGASESQSLIMLRVYSWIIPAGALTVPIVGKFLERFGSPLSMAVSTALSAALTLTICIPSLYAQYASFVLWAVGRTWLFSTYYATTGMLPAAVAGRAASFGILIMSTFSLLVMFLFWLGSSPFSGNFIPVFLILISLLIAQMVISRWFIARQRAMQEKEIAERQVQIAQSLAKDEHTKTVSEVAASTI
jgi:MFS family permease